MRKKIIQETKLHISTIFVKIIDELVHKTAFFRILYSLTYGHSSYKVSKVFCLLYIEAQFYPP